MNILKEKWFWFLSVWLLVFVGLDFKFVFGFQFGFVFGFIGVNIFNFK